MSITSASAYSPWILRWITLCMGLVALMVLIGGLTRLTESGLSIVEWKLLSGTLPPLTQQAWEAEFAAYQTSPEFQKVNHYMELSDFKRIFWLEYIHRLLGRVVGLCFALPFLYFSIRQQMDAALTRRMALGCILVAAQGAVGWVMVKSGLTDDPRVSPIRLASHLCLAFIVFCLMLWTSLQLREKARILSSPAWQPIAIRVVTALVLIQIILGAFVAGMDAGLSYNTFPLMDGEWIPDGLWMQNPWHTNLISNIITVQFQHRIGAYLVLLAVTIFAMLSWKAAATGLRAHLRELVAIMLVQFTLGVLTLIYAVPIALASAHQMVALALLAACIRTCYSLPLRRIETSLRTDFPKNSLID